MGGVIFVTIISLFHFFRNSQHPKKWSVSIWISSGNVNASVVVTGQCPQIYIKNSLRKTSLFVLFEHLPTGLLKYVWPFVTAQHEWVNNFLGFIWKNINEEVGKLV